MGVLKVRQAGEDVLQVSVWIDASLSATFDQCVDDGAALAGPSFAHEEPVLLSDGGGPDCVLDQIIVDLHFPIAQETSSVVHWLSV